MYKHANKYVLIKILRAIYDKLIKTERLQFESQ